MKSIGVPRLTAWVYNKNILIYVNTFLNAFVKCKSEPEPEPEHKAKKQ